MLKWLNDFKRFPYFLQHLYEKITTSIAFFPSIMAAGFFLLTGLMIFLEQRGLTEWMEERIPSFVLIKSWEVAQNILTTLIGALISLMVFSFSMVMVLLNNAASNYSPRVLPALISDKFHQFVLGTYLGTITYCLLLVINVTPSQPKVPLPSFSILLGIIFGLTCLMFFVFFIHSISESVQVEKILSSLEEKTLYNLKNGIISKLSDIPLPDNASSWQKYPSDRSGYLISINTDQLQELCEKNDIKLNILIAQGAFRLEGLPLFACNRSLEKELIHDIQETLVFSQNETVGDDYSKGFKQINEIAVKAMSPGINDPGTAISAINYLTILFKERMKIQNTGAVVLEKNGKERPALIWHEVIPFNVLLAEVLAPIRQYAKHDVVVVTKLIEMLHFLSQRSHCTDVHRESIKKEISILKIDIQENITNEMDLLRVQQLIKDTGLD